VALPLEASSQAHHVGPVAAAGLLSETKYHHRLDAKASGVLTTAAGGMTGPNDLDSSPSEKQSYPGG
jgi:hypothetical protein